MGKKKSRTHSWVGIEGKQMLHSKNNGGLKLEEVDKVLWRDGHEAAVWIVGCAWMATVLEHSKQPNCYRESREAVTHAVHRKHPDV